MTSTRSAWHWWWLAAPWPSLVIGALLMRHGGASPAVWGQNLVAGLFFTLICLGLGLWVRLSTARLGWIWTAVLGTGFLLGTFADAGSAGVHRWVQAGPVRLHAGEVCLPLLILALGKPLSAAGNNRGRWLAASLALGVLAVLIRQPDAAQASAFAGALLVLFCVGHRPSWMTCSVGSLMVAGAIWSWLRPDPLLPVPFVEGIVGMAARRGALWLWAAVASLALLPWPFFLARRPDGKPSSRGIAVGVYLCLSLLAPWIGHFPVGLLGFGFSPVTGYFAALAWLIMHSSRLQD